MKRHGDLLIEWFEVVSEWGGHRAVFRMLTDAPKKAGSNLRVVFSPTELQMLADSIGAVLPTPKLLDLRWKQCDCKNDPEPKYYVGGVGMDEPEAIEAHSARVDASIVKAGGGKSIGNVGKHWVLWEPCPSNKQRLYGWHVAGRAKTWEGTPLYAALSLPSDSVIDAIGRHLLDHTDYSMTGMLVHEDCEVNGVKMKVVELYRNTTLCGLAVHNALPLQHTRVIGVLKSESIVPGEPKPWEDDEVSLGERYIMWAENEMDNGVCEVPPRSNTGPRIKEYFANKMRKYRPGTNTPDAIHGEERPIRLSRGPWCAAAYCTGIYLCTMLGEQPSHGPRVSGYEMEQDAKATGRWRTKESVLKGEYHPRTGDGVILARGSGWQRHVAGFYIRTGQLFFQTIGANEGDQWRITDHRFDEPGLKGFIEQPRLLSDTQPDISPDRAAQLIDLSKSLMAGETEMEDAMREVQEREEEE